MSRQSVIALTVTVLAAVGVSVWSYRVEREGVTAGIWFEQIGPNASPEFTQRTGRALTPDEVVTVESIARSEAEAAFAMTCVRITSVLDSRYRVRVESGTLGLVAGQSRSLPGLRGNGQVSFASIAAGAVAFAPPGTDREGLVAAIGRGVGRTASHELAHQLLGSMDIHDTRDRLSYEFPDLRPEHFYQPLHWTIAAAPLRTRYGRGSGACR